MEFLAKKVLLQLFWMRYSLRLYGRTLGNRSCCFLMIYSKYAFTFSIFLLKKIYMFISKISSAYFCPFWLICSIYYDNNLVDLTLLFWYLVSCGYYLLLVWLRCGNYSLSSKVLPLNAVPKAKCFWGKLCCRFVFLKIMWSRKLYLLLPRGK